jgi:hypothetical protein
MNGGPVTSLATLWNGFRAVAFRAPRGNVADVGATTFFALLALYFVVEIALGALDSAWPWRIVPLGAATVLADALLTLLAAWILARIARRDAIVWGIASLLLAATIAVAIVVHYGLGLVAAALLSHGHEHLAAAIDIVATTWWLFVLFAVARWLAPKPIARAIVAALVAYAVSAALWWWLPAMPVLTNAQTSVAEQIIAANGIDVDALSGGDAIGDYNDNDDDANDDESNAPSEPTFDAETVMYDQPALLDAALAKIRPETPGKSDLFVVAFAGDARENVFRNEAEYTEKLFGQRFGADGRVLVLENNAASVATRPLATLTNLTWALDGIAKKMNPDEDILLVYVTTHGSHDHQLLVDLDPLPLDQIGPDDLADALKTKPGIRWKVVVVNACYSGGFVDAIRDDSTMVMTSAREDRTSFGCGADSDITYFGKAFLAEALNQTTSIRDAFDIATKSVDAWETRDKEEHSEPQIATSRSIEMKLDAWAKTLAPSPAVPFAPASAPDDDTPEDAPND